MQKKWDAVYKGLALDRRKSTPPSEEGKDQTKRKERSQELCPGWPGWPWLSKIDDSTTR